MGQWDILKYLKKHPNRKYSSTELFIKLKEETKSEISIQSLRNNLRDLCKNNQISSLPRVVRTFKGKETLKLVFFYNDDQDGFQDKGVVHKETFSEEEFYKYLK